MRHSIKSESTNKSQTRKMKRRESGIAWSGVEFEWIGIVWNFCATTSVPMPPSPEVQVRGC